MNITSAKRVSEFVDIKRKDNRGRVTLALVPGHKGTWYEVSVRRSKQGNTQVISTQCTCCKDKSPCLGNDNQICYHSLAVIIAGAKETKAQISFCKDEESVSKLQNMGGTPHLVQSSQSQKSVWVIIKDLLQATMVC